jgi:glycine cleavage system H protein
MRKYSEQHEWIEVKGDVGTVGISDFAQDELGEIVYVQLPEVGLTVEAGDDVAIVESTKAATDIYTPVSGEIVEVNKILPDMPEMINDDAEKTGWLFKVQLTDPAELDKLLSADAYQSMVQS